MNNKFEPPTALLLIASGCAICPIVHRIFSGLDKQGKLKELEVIDIGKQPERAQALNVRSVPWFRIGDLEFQGLHSAAEIEYWVSHALTEEGVTRYLTEELEGGRLHGLITLIRRHPHWLEYALNIVTDLQAPIQARIGLGAVFEDLQHDPLLQALVPRLSDLTQHSAHQVRADVCYYLGLSGSAASRPALSRCLEDSDPEVREIAREALAGLGH